MIETIGLLAAFSLVVMITGWIRGYAVGRQLVDIPGARSSHHTPTPRGAGLALVLVFLVGTLLSTWLEWVDPYTAVALIGAAGAVALVGWLDDHGHLAARWRLLVHFLAAAWGLAWMGGLPPVAIMGFQIDAGWVGHLLALFYVVWLLNLYNFMDGIDGLAGIQAVTTCLAMAGLLFWWGDAHAWWLPALLSAASAGFLVWNFPRARIFMGDVGSGTLGLLLGLLSLHAAGLDTNFLAAWLILLGVFIIDATTTLAVRLFRGMRVYEAHRSHAYQHAAQRFGSHIPVAVGVAVINLLWLLPIAILVVANQLPGAAGILIGYLPLLLLAITLRAGRD